MSAVDSGITRSDRALFAPGPITGSFAGATVGVTGLTAGLVPCVAGAAILMGSSSFVQGAFPTDFHRVAEIRTIDSVASSADLMWIDTAPVESDTASLLRTLLAADIAEGVALDLADA